MWPYGLHMCCLYKPEMEVASMGETQTDLLSVRPAKVSRRGNKEGHHRRRSPTTYEYENHRESRMHKIVKKSRSSANVTPKSIRIEITDLLRDQYHSISASTSTGQRWTCNCIMYLIFTKKDQTCWNQPQRSATSPFPLLLRHATTLFQRQSMSKQWIARIHQQLG